ncbi:phage tail protein, partial [Staphylococcus pseudintermedius]|nr:phage tail protein [Staphylococcus pseudintermedius]
MIHVLNFNSQIIDFISRDDNAVTIAKYHKTKDNDLLDIRILSQRAEHFKKRNRIIIQDKNGVYREYIIDRAEEDGRYVDVECTASHLVDISTSKPIPPGKYEKMTINQKLSETLRDSGWVVGDCDYAGLKTNSWTSVRTPLEMISQLETAHEVQADYEIEIDGYEVVERRVNMKIPAPLFKGKEIEYGKDLLSMKRVIDFSEVKTALFALGPEPEQGKRVETFVYDDEAQKQFDLPYRYIWGVYEPETEDDNMSLQRLTTLAKTELNKRKSAAVSYEISVVDIEKEFPHEVIRYGDIVRIKNPDFTPTLYAESEVIGIEHDLISNKCTYEFGKVVEYQEDDLLRYFRNRLGYFNQKFNDKFSNVNTIVRESIEGELQYFEPKILKGPEPPKNPVNDLLWLDTSNPQVAVLRRYWNGEWIKSSAENAEDVGAITREQALYSELNNTFVNLTIQHSRLMHEVSDVLESEYLVDTDLKAEVNSKLNETIGVFNEIKRNLDSMT